MRGFRFIGKRLDEEPEEFSTLGLALLASEGLARDSLSHTNARIDQLVQMLIQFFAGGDAEECFIELSAALQFDWIVVFIDNSGTMEVRHYEDLQIDPIRRFCGRGEDAVAYSKRLLEDWNDETTTVGTCGPSQPGDSLSEFTETVLDSRSGVGGTAGDSSSESRPLPDNNGNTDREEPEASPPGNVSRVPFEDSEI